MATYNQEQLTKKNTIYDLRTALNENTTQLRGGTSYTPLPFSIPYSDDFNKLNVDWLSNQDITFTNLTSTASTTVQGSFSAQQDATVGSTLDVTGITTLDSNLNVNADASVSGTVDVTGAGTSSFTNNVSAGGTLDVTGITTLSSALNANSDANVGGLLDVSGVGTSSFTNDVSVGGTLGVTGNGTFSNNLTVSGDLTVNGTSFTVDSETVATSETHILLNDGEAGSGVTDGTSGIEVDRGDLSNFRFQFNEATGFFELGRVGGTFVTAAGRETTPNDQGVAYWDTATNKFLSTTDAISDFTLNSENLSGLTNISAARTNIDIDSSAEVTTKADTAESNANSYTDTQIDNLDADINNNEWNQAYDDSVTAVSGSGNSTLTLTRRNSTNVTTDLSHGHDELVTGVSGSGNGTITISRSGTNVSTDLSHSHGYGDLPNDVATEGYADTQADNAESTAKSYTDSEVSAVQSQIETVKDELTRPNSPARLLIYYGYPISYQGLYDQDAIADAIDENYDVWICGDTYQDPTHEEYASTQGIITKLLNKGVEVWGYIPLGVSSDNLSMTEIETRCSQWNDLNVTGIFYDEFGFDYDNTRQRQIDAVNAAYAVGLPYCANAWVWEDVSADTESDLPSTWAEDDWRRISFNEGNPDEKALPRSSDDCYLMENWGIDHTSLSNVFQFHERAIRINDTNSDNMRIWAVGVLPESSSGVLDTSKTGPFQTAQEICNYVTASAIIHSLDSAGVNGFSFGAAGGGASFVTRAPELPMKLEGAEIGKVQADYSTGVAQAVIGNGSITVTTNETDGTYDWTFDLPMDFQEVITDQEIQAHIDDASNPHNVNQTDVGLSNVRNVAQYSQSEVDSNFAAAGHGHDELVTGVSGSGNGTITISRSGTNVSTDLSHSHDYADLPNDVATESYVDSNSGVSNVSVTGDGNSSVSVTVEGNDGSSQSNSTSTSHNHGSSEITDFDNAARSAVEAGDLARVEGTNGHRIRFDSSNNWIEITDHSNNRSDVVLDDIYVNSFDGGTWLSDLGTAAVRDVGTGADDVPSNSDLGTDWVLERISGASAGALGTYAFAWLNSTNTPPAFGATVSGGSLRPAGFTSNGGVAVGLSVTRFRENHDILASSGEGASTLSGTWRCMGEATQTDFERGNYPHTLWLRIA